MSMSMNMNTNRHWGLWQAVILLAGFLGGQLLVATGVTVLLHLVAHFFHAAAGAASGPGALVGPTLAGYCSAACWCVWYVRRRAGAGLGDGGPTGIGWQPAPAASYRMAALLAAGIILLVIIIIHLFPPNLARLQNLPAAKMFQSPGPAGFLLLLLAVFIAPPVEEFVFRGAIMAGLASKMPPLWAAGLTSLVFVAVHAPEKLYYPAGFIDVGLMAVAAAWLRVRYKSIKPCIFLHILYNGGLMLAAGSAG